LFMLFGWDHPDEVVRRSLSLFIIACPCALALATPLCLAQAHRLAAARGIFLRDPDVLERLGTIRQIIFDKTGTLTLGEPVVRDWEWSESSARHERSDLL